MRKVLARPSFLAVATVLALSGAALAADEPTLVPASERVYFATGCDEGAGGTCNTTQYWLGLSAGQSSVGTIPQTATPWNYAFSAAGNDIVYAQYTANEQLAPTYLLRADEPIRGQVQVTGWLGAGATLSADSTVRVELRAQRRTASGSWQAISLGNVTVNKQVASGSDYTYAFQTPVAPNLEKAVIRNLDATLWYKGVHVMTSGWVNGQGQSWFDLPHYVEVP